MNEGDYVVAINEEDVKWSPHDEVVTLIKSSGNHLKLKLVTPMDKSHSKENKVQIYFYHMIIQLQIISHSHIHVLKTIYLRFRNLVFTIVATTGCVTLASHPNHKVIIILEDHLHPRQQVRVDVRAESTSRRFHHLVSAPGSHPTAVSPQHQASRPVVREVQRQKKTTPK